MYPASEEQLVAPLKDPPKAKKSKLLLKLPFIALLCGACLLGFLLYKLGFKSILETISRIGWGFFIIVSFAGGRHCLRALCVYLSVPAALRKFSYINCLAARLAGESVSFLSFTGPFLGEAAKALLLKKNSVDLKQSIGAIVADNVIYYISVLVIIVGGSVTFLFFRSHEQQTTYAIFFAIGFAVLGFAAVVYSARKQFRIFSNVLNRLSKFKRVPKAITSKTEDVIEIERNFYEFYKTRRGTFFTLLGLDFLAHSLSVVEVFTALTLLGFSASVLNSFIIESLTKIINLTFSFVPGTLGFYEGGNEVILRTLGYAAVTGISLALVRKGAAISWIFVGFNLLMWRAFSSRILKR